MNRRGPGQDRVDFLRELARTRISSHGVVNFTYELGGIAEATPSPTSPETHQRTIFYLPALLSVYW